MATSKISRQSLLLEKGTVCANCQEDVGETIQFHHIVPQAIGGKDIITNIVPLCTKCHCMLHGITNDKGILRHGTLAKKSAELHGKKVGRPPMSQDLIDKAIELVNQGYSYRTVTKMLDGKICPATICKAMKKKNI